MSVKCIVSWSGEKSRRIASYLTSFLSRVLPEVEWWISERSLEPGREWWPELRESLRCSRNAILCLTQENMDASWLLFEAGAVFKGDSEARIHSILFGRRKLEEPLREFQYTRFGGDDMRKMLDGMRERLNDPPSFTEVHERFDRYWDDLRKAVESECADWEKAAPVGLGAYMWFTSELGYEGDYVLRPEGTLVTPDGKSRGCDRWEYRDGKLWIYGYGKRRWQYTARGDLLWEGTRTAGPGQKGTAWLLKRPT